MFLSLLCRALPAWLLGFSVALAAPGDVPGDVPGKVPGKVPTDTVGAAGAGAAADPAASGVWVYTVQAGDTLVGISARHLVNGVDWQQLGRFNRLGVPRRLQPGSRLAIPLAWLRRDPTQAEVIHLRGDVRRQGQQGSGALVVGERLLQGDVIESGPDSSATLRFADGSRLLLTPGSRITLDRMRAHPDSRTVDTRLRIERGSGETHVDPQTPARRSFEITTPTVNLGVRGTDFRVHADVAASRVEVLSGQVAAGADGGTRVDAGFGAVAAAGVPVSPPLRLAAAPDLSAVPERIEQLPLRFAWAPVDGVRTYRAQVFEPGPGGGLLLDGLFNEAQALWDGLPDRPDLPDAPYELRVRAIGPQGLEGLNARRQVLLKARPAPPPPLSPAPGVMLRGGAVQLRWASAAPATRYQVQVALATPGSGQDRQPDFSVLLADQAGLSTPALTVDLPPGAYLWRVRSTVLGAGGVADNGPWGAVQAFSIKPPPAAPLLQAPVQAEGGVLLRWLPAEPGAAGAYRYRVQAAQDASFSRLVAGSDGADTGTTLALHDAGRYHLRVQAVDADGTAGPFSAPQVIELLPAPWWKTLPAGFLILLLLL